jgi:hypothetical protein
MNRECKSHEALAILVMNEVGLCEELVEFKGVTILRTDRRNPKASNWEAVFETLRYSGADRPTPMPIAHPLADEIVRKLQLQYDLN